MSNIHAHTHTTHTHTSLGQGDDAAAHRLPGQPEALPDDRDGVREGLRRGGGGAPSRETDGRQGLRLGEKGYRRRKEETFKSTLVLDIHSLTQPHTALHSLTQPHTACIEPNDP